MNMEQITERSSSIQSKIRAAEAQIQEEKDRIDTKLREMQNLHQRLRDHKSVLKDDEIRLQEKKIRRLREEISACARPVNVILSRWW